MKNADGLIAIINGVPPDENVMDELGFSIALAKLQILFGNEFCKCTDSDEYIHKINSFPRVFFWSME